MTGLRLDLANPGAYETPRDYIENHLAPVVTELHKLVNEFLTPGSTSSEEHAVDMEPATTGDDWSTINRLVRPTPKMVTFDGREYFAIPKETLRAKQLKVQLVATVYTKGTGPASFRLIRGDGHELPSSVFTVRNSNLLTVTRVLPFGEGDGCVTPTLQTYIMQAKRSDRHSTPVCRRFSLSFVYI